MNLLDIVVICAIAAWFFKSVVSAFKRKGGCGCKSCGGYCKNCADKRN